MIHDLTVGANLYRIAQEAVFNAFKHAGAKNISIELSAMYNEVSLTVSDDGAGFSSTPKNKEGMGLHIMHYRARMIGATLQICPGTAGGTTVVCSIQNAATLESEHVST
jgi:two-component system CheB/CheR fusion protein